MADTTTQTFLYRRKLSYQPSLGDSFHVVQSFDTLESLAGKFYGDAKYWWIIYDINDDTILNPFILELGSSILIPDLDTIKSINF